MRNQEKMNPKRATATLVPIPNVVPVPQHPFMAANNRSNVHCDAYQSDTYTCMGPNPFTWSAQRVAWEHDNELCIGFVFDKSGNPITVSNWSDATTTYVDLLLLDKTTLKVVIRQNLWSIRTDLITFGLGAYAYLDNNDQVVVTTGNLIQRYAVNSTASAFDLVATYKTGLPEKTIILSVMPDWSNNLWFITYDGWVGCFKKNTTSTPWLAPFLKMTGIAEMIGNSLAVDDTGGVFIVSTYALYRFDYDDFVGTKTYTWRQEYDRGSGKKPGQFNQGSGTTPTLLDVGNERYVAITDNAEPQMNVVVCRRKAVLDGDETRLVGQVPVFQSGQSANENSLIGVGGSFVVENNYGYIGSYTKPQAEQTTPGFARIGVDGTPAMVWNNDKISIPSVVSKGSIPDSWLYTYTLEIENTPNGTVQHWFFYAVDFTDGSHNDWNVGIEVGQGVQYDNHYSGIILNPDNADALIPVYGGVVRVRGAY